MSLTPDPDPESTSGSSLGLFSDELARLAQSLGTARDLLSVFRALRLFAESVTGSNSLFVSLLEPEATSRRCVYAWSDGEEVDVATLPLLPMSGGPHARAVATGQVVLVEDLQAALQDTPNVPLGYDRDPREPSVSIALPLAVLGRVIGGFEVQLFEHVDPRRCIPSLQVAANLAAAATENVRLVETERELRLVAETSEQRYRANEDRLRLALEATGLATWDVDARSGEFTWSIGTERVFGRPHHEPPKNWDDLVALVHPDDRSAVERMLESVGPTVGALETEFRVAWPDGEVRWLSVRGHTLMDAHGGAGHFSAVIQDITERKESEHQREWLARSEQMRVLGQMASGIAHDLNQALALISGYGELAGQELTNARPDLARVSELLEVSVRAAHDGAATLRRLLSFTRTPSAEAFEVVDVGELLREMAKLTAPRWQAAVGSGGSIRLDLDIDPAADLRIDGSLAALREGFTNLIFNAVDALSNGGTLTLRATRSNSRVLVQIADTGIGIPADVQARIFEPFFTTKGERGTGLGLAQVATVVTRHGGQVSVDSLPGKGTTFSLLFPPARGHLVQVERTIAPVSARPTSRRVLAVDDEPALNRLLSIMLTSEGHQVTLAPSGEEALQLLRQGEYDLVLSDVNMGEGMTGWDLADRIRELWPELTVVLVSGLAAQIMPDEARAHGVAAVLAKPYHATEVRDLVATIGSRA